MPSVFVAGLPAPQGSKTRGRHGGLYESSARVGPWRELVGLAARDKCASPTSAAVGLALVFTFARPGGDFKKNGGLRARARPAMTTIPDLDKLARAVLDALAGVVYLDDKQVVELGASKRYGERPGVFVRWTVLE